MAVDVTDQEALSRWLEKQRREVVVGFAARSALRVFPILSSIKNTKRTANEIILSLIRGISQPSASGLYLINGKRLRDAAEAVEHAITSYSVILPASAASFAVYSAACEATYAANSTSAIEAAAFAIHTVAFAGDAFARSQSSVAPSVSDADAIEEALEALAARIEFNGVFQYDIDNGGTGYEPLWQTESGNDIPADILKHWNRLKYQLLDLHPNWHVWTDWYEARLWPDKFPAPIEELEIARALIPEEIWKGGWEVVNPYIEGLIEEHRPVVYPDDIGEPEPQNPISTTFVSNGDNPITVNELAGVLRLMDDQDAIDRYAETRSLAQKFIDEFNRDLQGANQATGLLDDVKSYLEALGENLATIRPSFAIIRGDKLRTVRNNQETRDDLSNLPELSDKHLEELDAIVAAHNLMVSFDSELARRDLAILGPDVSQTQVSPEEGQILIHDAVVKEAAEHAVENILAEEAALVPKIPDAGNRKSRRYSEGVKNFVRKVASVLWRHKGKIIVTSGTLIFSAANWLVMNKATILPYFTENPAMLDILPRLVMNLEKYPLLLP